MACAENPGLRFVFSNTTEAGIAYNAGDRLEDRPPRSFPGKAASFLYKRFRFFNGDTSKALVFIPCELIDKNGDKLKELVERYGREWNLGDAFSAWLGACDFCNSLVDRIVPGYPREEAEALQKKLGYADALLDAAEVFHLWVIETKQDHSAELPLVQAGLNVIWTEDMSFYRTRKVRILNGAHTLMVPAAFLCGLNTVGECVDDPLIARFMKKGIFDEIIPSMDGDAGELVRYAGDVLDRFANPSIRHPLLSITLNSVSKFRTRLLPSLLGYLKKKGALPVLISFSLAALIAFYRGSGPVNGELQGDRNGEAYPVRDDEDILKRFAEWYAAAGDLAAGDAARGLVHEVLSAAGFWGEDLSAVPGLEEAVFAHFGAIQNHGVRSALEGVVSHA
jgi:tagaturonate reductase